MPSPLKSYLIIGIALVSLVFAPRSEAHRPIATNMAIDIELKGNLLVVEPWIPTFLLPPLQDITFENQDEWPTAEARRAEIEEFFDRVCPVEIDGEPVKPVMQKLRLQPMEQAKHLDEFLDFVEARILLHYEVESPPEKMKLRWGIYPPVPPGGWGELVDADQNPQEFDMMMFVDNKEDFIFFSPEEPELFWQRRPKEVKNINVITPEELSAGESAADDTPREKPKFPIATVAVATLGILFFVVGRFAKIASPVRFGVLLAAAIGAFFLRPQATSDPRSLSSITEDQAVEKFERLQANMYSAFDYEEEEQVYDVLAQSVDGALLDDIYAEVYQSLLVVDKSSAVCKVHEVEVLESRATAVDPSSDGRAQRFDIACHWRVHGVVKHFEHIHRRVNEYRADYRLTKKPEGWKITGVAVSEQDRLDPRTLKPSEDY